MSGNISRLKRVRSRNLEMKTALVTGGARGIGAAIAEKLKKSGYNVVINYFSSEESARKMAENGFFAVRADVSDERQVDKMFDEISSRFGGVDVLVNNAASALRQKIILDVTAEEFDRLFAVDVRGVFLCTRRAVEDMLRLGRGDVVNVSSVWGAEGASCEVVYSAAKGAVDAMTRSLAKEYENTDICFQTIAPMFVETDMNAHLSDEDKRDFLLGRGLESPLRPEDVAWLVGKMLEKRENGRMIAIESREKIYRYYAEKAPFAVK